MDTDGPQTREASREEWDQARAIVGLVEKFTRSRLYAMNEAGKSRVDVPFMLQYTYPELFASLKVQLGLVASLLYERQRIQLDAMNRMLASGGTEKCNCHDCQLANGSATFKAASWQDVATKEIPASVFIKDV